MLLSLAFHTVIHDLKKLDWTHIPIQQKYQKDLPMYINIFSLLVCHTSFAEARELCMNSVSTLVFVIVMFCVRK